LSDEPTTANGHQGRTDKRACQADVTEIERAHERIVEAIIDGDDSLARNRTRRHLDGVAS
jgi:DNA-binding FadR family transcriptional regulator